MPLDREQEVRRALEETLARLWRYGLVLSGRRDVAEDLVQATCVRALERCHQAEPGSRLDRWFFAILHSIWLNEVRAGQIRAGNGFVEAEDVLVTDGEGEMEAVLLAAEIRRQVQSLPEAQRETVFLVYGEGLVYREAAAVLGVPIGTVMSRLAAARATLARLHHGEGNPSEKAQKS